MVSLRRGNATPTWLYLGRIPEDREPERQRRLETCRRELAERVDPVGLEAAVRLLGESARDEAWPALWSLLPFCPDPLLEAETVAALTRLEWATRGRRIPDLPMHSSQEEDLLRTLLTNRRQGRKDMPGGPTERSLRIGGRFLDALAQGRGRQATDLIALPFFLGDTFQLKNSEEARQAFAEVRRPLHGKVLHAGPVSEGRLSREEARFLEGLPAWSVRAVHIVVRIPEEPPREGVLFVQWHPGPPRILGLGTKGH